MFVVLVDETSVDAIALRKPWSVSRLDQILPVGPREAEAGSSQARRLMSKVLDLPGVS